VQLLSDSKMNALLEDSREFNAKVHVTGVLLHNDGSFFQYFEGPASGVAEVYSRILKSRSHHSIVELLDEPIARRVFAKWHMGSTQVPEEAMLSLRTSEWTQLKDKVQFEDNSNLGLLLLRMHLASVDVAF
jgi:hypothetical protein